MVIFAVETSCDETSVAVMRNGREQLSCELYSQADMHAMYGGVVPEIASRNHAAIIGRLSDFAIKNAGITKKDIDAVAVTYAPGLIGALLVGVNFAKGLAMALDVPVIPVHHIRGHIAANYIAYPELEPPFLCVIISGGNSIIADVRDYTDISIVGRSRDDAAGECFDKVARILGLGYPGGAAIDKLSQGGDDTLFDLPHPVIEGFPYDMSFSGLKTAVVNIVHNASQKAARQGDGSSVFPASQIEQNLCNDRKTDEPSPCLAASLAASFTRTMSEILVPRVMAAAAEFGHDKIALAGGVAANTRIRADFTKAAEAESKKLFIPPLNLCGDNAAMIGCQGFYEYKAGVQGGMELDAYATMDVEIRVL
ncbi:MAG: tRNA (adenosine(37)-N6)-threonylcarbamoyltransferase complex transferase subunit TsaD [Oscillospiraceae bacterium]|nr:tRNA (adenosine(37)-N6)-threonylcarbamoyltransferase complex transferase subunit TsaD [Oscillospiraceae bacterium]